MWRRLRRALARLLHPAAPENEGRELRTASARAQFWSELRDGEREAENAAMPSRSTAADTIVAPRRPQET